MLLGFFRSQATERAFIAGRTTTSLKVASSGDVPLALSRRSWNKLSSVVKTDSNSTISEWPGPDFVLVRIGVDAETLDALGILVYSNGFFVHQDGLLRIGDIAQILSKKSGEMYMVSQSYIAHDERSSNNAPDGHLCTSFVVSDAIITDQQHVLNICYSHIGGG